MIKLYKYQMPNISWCKTMVKWSDRSFRQPLEIITELWDILESPHWIIATDCASQPCCVLASPWAPSTRFRWRLYNCFIWPSQPFCLRLRARNNLRNRQQSESFWFWQWQVNIADTEHNIGNRLLDLYNHPFFARLDRVNALLQDKLIADEDHHTWIVWWINSLTMIRITLRGMIASVLVAQRLIVYWMSITLSAVSVWSFCL